MADGDSPDAAAEPAASDPAPAALSPPIVITIEASPEPLVRLRVAAWGDEAADRGWLDYGWTLVEEFLRRHERFASSAEARLSARIEHDKAEAAAARALAAAPGGPTAAVAPPRASGAGNPSVGSGGRPAGRPGGAARRAGPGRGGGGGASRAERFDPAPGWECDRCGGPCGVKYKTGRMRFDSVVCLGSCKDENGYVYEVGRLDD